SNSVVRLFASYQLFQPNKDPSFSVTMNTGSLFDCNSFNEWIGPLSISAAQINTGVSGVLFLNDDITVVANNFAASVITGNVQLFTSTHTITNTGHAVSPDLYVLANIGSSGGSYGLIKTGNGEVSLASASGNSFSGPVTVNQGSLWLQTSNAVAF